MEHNDVRHKLSEYIDGSSSLEEREKIETHLKTCAECSEALSELRKTIEHVKAVEEIEPPAWMKQKIMAKVREEATKKKGWFERFFLPFSVKFPIQAVAVVFLAVTAFYIYRSMQPASMQSETPIQEFSFVKEPVKDKLAKTDDHAARARRAPQTPEYKALDMKQEYEAPMAPSRMNAPAPAEERSAAHQPMAAEEAIAAKSQAGAPAAPQQSLSDESSQPTPNKALDVMSQKSRATDANREEFTASPGLKAEAEPHKHAKKAKKAARGDEGDENAVEVTIKVSEFDNTAKEIEKAVTAFGGKIVRTVPSTDNNAITVSIKEDKLAELLLKLKTIGKVDGNSLTPVGGDRLVVVRITLTKNKQGVAAGC